MRIAVLGATSQIARDLVQLFSATGDHDWVLYARRPEVVIQWLADTGLAQRHEVAAFSAFTPHQPFDAILNCVGVGNPAQAVAIGASIFDVTTQCDDLALRYVQKHPTARYIFLSSGAVFGGSFAEPVTADWKAIFPINQMGAQDWYGVAKMWVECRHRALSALPIVDVRIFNYFSSSADIANRFLVTDILRALVAKDTFHTSPEDITRDYLGPGDLHQLMHNILQNGPVNVAVDCYSKMPVGKLEMLAAMQEKFGLSYALSPVNHGINATGNKKNYYSKNHVAHKIFGYIPKLSALENVLTESEILLQRQHATNFLIDHR